MDERISKEAERRVHVAGRQEGHTHARWAHVPVRESKLHSEPVVSVAVLAGGTPNPGGGEGGGRGTSARVSGFQQGWVGGVGWLVGGWGVDIEGDRLTEAAEAPAVAHDIDQACPTVREGCPLAEQRVTFDAARRPHPATFLLYTYLWFSVVLFTHILLTGY